jgi:hypothetical protein
MHRLKRQWTYESLWIYAHVAALVRFALIKGEVKHCHSLSRTVARSSPLFHRAVDHGAGQSNFDGIPSTYAGQV